LDAVQCGLLGHWLRSAAGTGFRITRMGKLTLTEIDDYFDKHLPYRRRILLAHYRMTRRPWRGDPGQLDACFVAALVTARLFLNVLGISKNGEKLGRFGP